MKIIERLLEKMIQESINVDAKQFGFMPDRETVDALLFVRSMQEKYRESCAYVLWIFGLHLKEFQGR